MKKITDLCLKACAYTTLILALYYLVTAIVGASNTWLPSARFFLILLFGFIISFAEYLYKLLSIKPVLKFLIHYTVLLCAFFIIFIISGNIVVKGAATVFASISLFTVFYFLLYFIVHYVGMLIGKLDEKNAKTSNKSKKSKDKAEYTPRYKAD